jgi:hypothetical protein
MSGVAAVTWNLVGWRDRRGRFAKESDDLRERARDVARGVMKSLVERARQESPVGFDPFETKPEDYVHFRDAWTSKYSDADTGATTALINTSDHAVFVLNPTRAHDIDAKTTKVLRFGTAGSPVFVAHVHHPGTRGNPVGERVASALGGYANDELQKAAAAVMNTIEGLWR